MRSIHFIPAVLIAIGCTPEQQILAEQVVIEGDVPADADLDQATQDFLASGAQFGVIVDPVTGETTTLTNLDRAITSNDFSLADAATCVDCGDPTCATGMGRQINVPMRRDSGSGVVDVNYTRMLNWTPTGETCDGGACPTNINASTVFDVDLVGNLTSCSVFNVFFDVDDNVYSGTTTLSPPAAINNSIGQTCADVVIDSAAGAVAGNVRVDIAMSHTWIGDLDIQVISPDGTMLTAMNRPGRTGGSGLGNNRELVTTSPISFFDGAATDAEDMGDTLANNQTICLDDGECEFSPNPDEVVSSPANFAAAFNGLSAAGTWQVCVFDGQSGDSGTLETATITLTTSN
ncbi:MAG: proprotein convertase P-domain-containing protein [Alphaproteobacteria bacterium]|nr:proprotein convertase P-domain-containing protein [Alphaproteobacteria bacterium]